VGKASELPRKDPKGIGSTSDRTVASCVVAKVRAQEKSERPTAKKNGPMLLAKPRRPELRGRVEKQDGSGRTRMSPFWRALHRAIQRGLTNV